MKRNMKRRGFTLVELLIVIVVIGILSAMMMLS
ncbi:MAG: type II secretion system protein, partial [Synergistaceae bacterium]|nr:type II secretion system protein [Synergistaceae bacterium]